MADRYSYLPIVGIFVMIAWGVPGLTRGLGRQTLYLSASAALALALCVAVTRQQLCYWKEDETLFRHATAVTRNNYIAHNMLGIALERKGQVDGAIAEYAAALTLKPSAGGAHNNLGIALRRSGRLSEAIHEFEEASRFEPYNAAARANLGDVFELEGRLGDAARQFQEALNLGLDSPDVHCRLGAVLAKMGRTNESMVQFEIVLKLYPWQTEAEEKLRVLRSVFRGKTTPPCSVVDSRRNAE